MTLLLLAAALRLLRVATPRAAIATPRRTLGADGSVEHSPRAWRTAYSAPGTPFCGTNVSRTEWLKDATGACAGRRSV